MKLNLDSGVCTRTKLGEGRRGKGRHEVAKSVLKETIAQGRSQLRRGGHWRWRVRHSAGTAGPGGLSQLTTNEWCAPPPFHPLGYGFQSFLCMPRFLSLGTEGAPGGTGSINPSRAPCLRDYFKSSVPNSTSAANSRDHKRSDTSYGPTSRECSCSSPLNFFYCRCALSVREQFVGQSRVGRFVGL